MTPAEVLAPVEALAGSREHGGNDTPVNDHYNVPGVAYCGYLVRYAFEASGNGAELAKSTNTAYVPTFRAFAREYWERVPNSEAQKGDVFFYRTDHTGFVFEPYAGETVITLEGNAMVYATAAEARAAHVGGGAFEGIGYKKRRLTDDYQVYRPPYDGSAKKRDMISIQGFRLERGATGSAVRALQALLNFRGFNCGMIDGDFGENTYMAVRSLQVHYGLEADGIAGAQTWGVLIS